MIYFLCLSIVLSFFSFSSDVNNRKIENQKVISFAKGDLNEDNKDDIVVITEKETGERILSLFFYEKNAYCLSLQTKEAVLLSKEGGPYGDPFESLKIENGCVVLNFLGGSAKRWAESFYFHYQNEDWYLIRAVFLGYDTKTLDSEEKDFNLLTGFMKKTTIVDEQEKSEWIETEKKQQIKLKNFRIHEISGIDFEFY